MFRILLVPGDGVGPSLIESAETVLTVAGDGIEIVHGDLGFNAYERTGEYIPSDTLDLIRECGNVICGPFNPYRDQAGKQVDILDNLKVGLDLYATVRVFRTLGEGFGVPGLTATLWASNTVLGHDVSETRDFDGITISKYIRSSSYSRMMARALSDLELSGKKRICCITREDLFPDSSGLFVEAFDSLFPPDVYQTDHMNIQKWASRVVRDPFSHDYLICADLYSHVAAGIMAGLTGGNHLSPIGYAGDSVAMMVPGQMPTYAGAKRDAVNPTSAIMSCAMLMFNQGMTEEAGAIFSALEATYAAGELTPDLGGSLTTSEFTDRVVSRI